MIKGEFNTTPADADAVVMLISINTGDIDCFDDLLMLIPATQKFIANSMTECGYKWLTYVWSLHFLKEIAL